MAGSAARDPLGPIDYIVNVSIGLVLAGSLAVPTLGAVLTSLASSHLLTRYNMAGGIQGNLDINWATVVGGFATLSIGHVMERTVPMREEIEATV